MKAFGILLLVPFLFIACNKVVYKMPLADNKEAKVEMSSYGRGATKIDLDPTTGVVSIIGCYDATTHWMGLKTIPETFQGIVAAYRGIAPAALGGGASKFEPSPISGCDALLQNNGDK